MSDNRRRNKPNRKRLHSGGIKHSATHRNPHAHNNRNDEKQQEGFDIAELNRRSALWLEQGAEWQYRDHDDIILAAVKAAGEALQYASNRLRNSPEVVLAAVGNNSDSFVFAGKKLQEDRPFLLKTVKLYPKVLKLLLPEIQDDRAFVGGAIQQQPHAWYYAKTRFRNDKKLLLHTLRNVEIDKVQTLFRLISDRLRDDREVAMAAMQRDGDCWSEISYRLQDDRQMVLFAVEKGRYFCTSRLPKKWYSDREVVLAAVRRDGYFLGRLEFNSELRGDRTVGITAVKSFPGAFPYLSYDLRADPELVLMALRKGSGYNWQHASNEIQQTRRDVVLAAVDSCGRVLAEMSSHWQMDREIVMMAIEHGEIKPTEWRYFFAEFLLRDKELVLSFAEHADYADYDENEDGNHFLRHIPDYFKRDPEIILAAVENSGLALKHVLTEMMDEEVVVAAICQPNCGWLLEFAPLRFRNDPEMVAKAINHHGLYIWFEDWHNMRRRLRDLHKLLSEKCGETILEELFSRNARGKVDDTIQNWILEKCECAWLVRHFMEAEVASRINQDVCTIILQFAGISQAMDRSRELQQMAPLCFPLKYHCGTIEKLLAEEG